MDIKRALRVFLSLFVAVVLSALAGCGKGAEERSTSAAVNLAAPPLSPTSKATPDGWKNALEASFVMTDVKDGGEGVTEFSACFKRVGKNCDAFAFGSRDAFRKLRFFTAGTSSAMDVFTYVPIYISLRDNERPSLFLAPYFFSKGGWIFLNKIAIMLDGDVVLEQDFEGSAVKRNPEAAGVAEKVHFIASEQQIASLRKIKPESTLLIRFTGQNGHISLDKKRIEYFKSEIANALFIYDTINHALDGKVPTEVGTGPK